MRASSSVVPWNAIRPPHRMHVGAIGDLDRPRRVLLDEQDRHPFLLQLLEDLEDLVDDERREAERRLVEQQELRAREQGARRSRAAAARRPRASSPGGRRAPQHLEALAHPLDVRLRRAPVGPGGRADFRFSPTGAGRRCGGSPERARCRAGGSPRATRRRSARPRKMIWPGVGFWTPVIVHSVVDLPAPLCPTRPTSSPCLTSSESS